MSLTDAFVVKGSGGRSASTGPVVPRPPAQERTRATRASRTPAPLSPRDDEKAKEKKKKKAPKPIDPNSITYAYHTTPQSPASPAVPLQSDGVTRLDEARSALHRVEAALQQSEKAAASREKDPEPLKALHSRVDERRRLLEEARSRAQDLRGEIAAANRKVESSISSKELESKEMTEAVAQLRQEVERFNQAARAVEAHEREAKREHRATIAKLTAEVTARRTEAESLRRRLVGLESDSTTGDAGRAASAMLAAEGLDTTAPMQRTVDSRTVERDELHAVSCGSASGLVLHGMSPQGYAGCEAAGRAHRGGARPPQAGRPLDFHPPAHMPPIWGVLEGAQRLRGWRGPLFTPAESAAMLRDAVRFLELRRPGTPWHVSLPLFLWTRTWYAPVVYLQTAWRDTADGRTAVWEVLNGREEFRENPSLIERHFGAEITTTYKRGQDHRRESDFGAFIDDDGDDSDEDSATPTRVVQGWDGLSLYRSCLSEGAFMLRYDGRQSVAAGRDYAGYTDSVLWVPEPEHCLSLAAAEGDPPKRTWFTMHRPHPSALELVFSHGCGDALCSQDDQLLSEPLLDPEIDALLQVCRAQPNLSQHCPEVAALAVGILEADVPRPLVLAPQVQLSLHAVDGSSPQRALSVLLTARDPAGGASVKLYINASGEPGKLPAPSISLESRMPLCFEAVDAGLWVEGIQEACGHETRRSSAAPRRSTVTAGSSAGPKEHPGAAVFIHAASAQRLEELVQEGGCALAGFSTAIHGVVLPNAVLMPGGGFVPGVPEQASVVKAAGPHTSTYYGAFAPNAVQAGVAAAFKHCTKAMGCVAGVAPLPQMVAVAVCYDRAKQDEAADGKVVESIEGSMSQLLKPAKGAVHLPGTVPAVFCVRVQDVMSNVTFDGAPDAKGRILCTFVWSDHPRVTAVSIRCSLAEAADDREFLTNQLRGTLVRNVRAVFVYACGGEGHSLPWADSLPRGCVVHGGVTPTDGSCDRVVVVTSERKICPVMRNSLVLMPTLLCDSKPIGYGTSGVSVPYSLLRQAVSTGRAQPFDITLDRVDGEGTVVVQLMIAADGAHDAGKQKGASVSANTIESGFSIPPLLLRGVVEASQERRVEDMTPGELIEAFSVQILHWERRRMYIASFSGRRHILAEHVQTPVVTKAGQEIVSPSSIRDPGRGTAAALCELCGGQLHAYAAHRTAWQGKNENDTPYLCYYTDCSTKQVDICKLCAYKAHVYSLKRYGRKSRHQYYDVVQRAIADRIADNRPLLTCFHPGKGNLTYTASNPEVRDLSKLEFVNAEGERHTARPQAGATYNTADVPYGVDLGTWMFPEVQVYVAHLLHAVQSIPALESFAFSGLSNRQERLPMRTQLRSDVWGLRFLPAWCSKLHRGNILFNVGIMSAHARLHVDCVHSSDPDEFFTPYNVHTLAAAHPPQFTPAPQVEVVPLRILSAPGEGLRGQSIAAYSRQGRVDELVFPPHCTFYSDSTRTEAVLREVTPAAAASILIRRLLLDAPSAKYAQALFAVLGALAPGKQAPPAPPPARRRSRLTSQLDIDVPRPLSLVCDNGNDESMVARAKRELGDEGAAGIADALALGAPLVNISLQNQCVRAKGCLSLLDALRVNTGVREINLSDTLAANKDSLHVRDAINLRLFYNSERHLATMRGSAVEYAIPYNHLKTYGDEWPAVAALALHDVPQLRVASGSQEAALNSKWKQVLFAFRDMSAAADPVCVK